jgi:selenocysteine lyase/cysteine desulfurase
MTSRRAFLRHAAALALTPQLRPFTDAALADLHRAFPDQTPEQVARNEDFWVPIQQAFTVSPTILNLNNGGVSPAPKTVQDALERYNHYANEAPSYFMWRIMDQGREPLREQLAALAGVSAEEIAVNRNATEALDTIIFGLPLRAGDEVVLSKYDYPNMLHAWRQRELRDGLKLRYVNVKFPSENETELADAYTEQFSPQTKVVHLTHLVNWTGQILPVARIAREAHRRGIEVLVDGAHSFAHLDYKISDLGCDYFGTSLHKWLCAPIGSGMLWMKKEKIASVFPLIANDKPQSDNIRKFENLGTRSFPIEQGVAQAVRFHQALGTPRKRERLFFLKNYWAEKAAQLPGVKLFTSLKKDFSGAICLFGIEGLEPAQVESQLLSRFKIHTSPTVWEDIKGVRVTPHIYTTLSDLDRLVDAIGKLAKRA